jgi:aspartyl-tRNA synthetase
VSAMIRTHEAGTLRASHAGERVVLAGWVARRRDHGGVVFIDLRDASGMVQVVWRGDEAVGHELRAEFCVLVTGMVRQRPAGNENPDLPTGEIEVAAEEVEVLSEAEPLPFPVEDSPEVSEDIRLKYRYLDIRRSDTAQALRTRSQAAYLLSDVMREHRFVNVETPYLTRSTPEGARDFLVPVRLRPGNWYALPQSPQLFKQLLMVGGLERYFQLARCFRDEDFRKDRQPEFTQIDIEMSFVTRGHRGPAVVRAGRLPGAPAAAPDDLCGRAGAVRLGQARPALRLRAHRPDRVLRRHGVPGLPGPVHRGRGHARRRVAVAAGV